MTTKSIKDLNVALSDTGAVALHARDGANKFSPLRTLTDFYKIGDRVTNPKAAFVIQGRDHCAVAEEGVVIWVGDMSAFCKLIRDAANKECTA